MRRFRLLILGASGSVGSRLYEALGQDRAIATYHSAAIAGAMHFDGRTMRLADHILPHAGIVSHAIILLGITNIDACARDPAGSRAINVDGTCRIIDDLIEHDIVPVFISSDAVFDGSRGGWSETDPPRPILTYGRQKLEVEQYLENTGRAALIVRLAKVVGTMSSRSDMLENWMDAFESGDVIRCARDQIFSPVQIDDVVASLIRLAEGGHTGLFHLGGPTVLSRLDLLETLLREVQRHRRPIADIVACNLRELPFEEPRPLNSSLSADKLSASIDWQCRDMKSTCAVAAIRRYGDRLAL
jgi:dTDP-4-dehydrorhamnose reductase